MSVVSSERERERGREVSRYQVPTCQKGKISGKVKRVRESGN